MIGDLFRGAGLALVGGALAIIVLIVFGVMWVFGVGMFERGTANFRGQTAQTNQVLANPDYRIAAYEHFYDQCAAVQTAETRIARFRADVAGDARGSQQWTADRADLDAAVIDRADLINTYNADARKADTKAHFLASDLPYQIDPTEDRTTCTAS